MTQTDIENKIFNNEDLLNKIIYFKTNITLEPNTDHFCVSIKKECCSFINKDFIDSLKTTIIPWVFGESEIKEKKAEYLKKSGQKEMQQAAVYSKISQDADKYFRVGHPCGQFGELLLFNFIQSFYRACPLLRKMTITTNEKLERNGSDAIHIKIEGGFFVLYIGEAKVYPTASFGQALTDSIESVSNTINNLRNELNRYIISDFRNKDFDIFLKEYKEGINLDKIKYKPICIIVYNENHKIDFDKDLQDEIKNLILKTISKLRKTIDYSILGSYLKDLEYIIFPIFDLDSALQMFDNTYNKNKKDE